METNSDDSDEEFVIEIKDWEKTVVEKYSKLGEDTGLEAATIIVMEEEEDHSVEKRSEVQRTMMKIIVYSRDYIYPTCISSI